MYGITKRRTLSSEITVLNMLTSVCTLLFLGIAMLLVFFFVFFEARKMIWSMFWKIQDSNFRIVYSL